MRIIRKCAVILTVVMLFAIATVHAANEKLAKYTIEFRYDSTLNEFVGDVYLYSEVRLEGGSFGIKFDPLLASDVRFELDTKFFTYACNRYDPNNPYDPNDPNNFDDVYCLEDGSNYIAFSWGRANVIEGGLTGTWHLGSIYVKNVTMTTDDNGNPIPAGWHKESMYQLDWLSTYISQADMFTKDKDGINLNREIWRALDKATDTEEAEIGVDDALYGYYQGVILDEPDENEKVTYTWIDIGYDLVFEGELPDPPSGKTVSGDIFSYNKNNDITVKLLYEDGTEYKTCTAVTKKEYTDGRVRSQYTFSDVEAGTYILKAEKDVHLTYYARITVAESVLKNIGQLSCGDITGDEKIKINDRTILLRYLNTGAAKCDLNGDGKVTIHDLDILKRFYNEVCKGIQT